MATESAEAPADTAGVVNARLPRDLNAMLTAIAAYRMSSVADAFSELCRSDIERRFATLPAEMRERALSRVRG